MNTFSKMLVGMGLGSIILIIALVLSGPPVEQGNPVVKVMYEQGHGSATHIGGGLFITAAHVVDGQEDSPTLIFENGTETQGEILWADTTYDVALISAPHLSDTYATTLPQQPYSTLFCDTPSVGDEIKMMGNPMNLNHISTWGRVAGAAQEVGPWGNVIPVDGTILPGMSGGGVFNEYGDFIGVNVGVMVASIGFGGSISGIGYVVPGTTVCKLLGKA